MDCTVVQWYSGTVVQMGLIYMDGTQADHAGPLHSAVVGVECTCLTFLHRVFSNCLLKLPAYGDAKLHLVDRPTQLIHIGISIC